MMSLEAFSDLPDALVKQLLEMTLPIAEGVKGFLVSFREKQDSYRRKARTEGLIQKKADLEVPREPSVAGVDGSYQIHRLTSLDLAAAAAVAVEGTSKEERNRYWPEPHHRMWMNAIPHSPNSSNILRGIMVSMELELASFAPHDLVLLDGSFASLIIYLHQGLTSITVNKPGAIDLELQRQWQDNSVFQLLIKLLRSEQAVAVPKYTARTELVDKLGLGEWAIDDKTLATMILQPGEYTQPIALKQDDDFHLPPNFCSYEENKALNQAMHELRVIYFRPYGWLPALRLEVPGSSASSRVRLSTILEGIQRQFFNPAVHEPYPLFLADRMVKSLGAGVAVVEQAVAQHVADSDVDIETVLLCLQNYRTEGGHGGVL